MNVAKVMRRDVPTLRPQEDIEAAWRWMREHRLGLLPVADAADRFVGVLTERALLVRLTPRRTRRWWEALIDDHDRPALDCLRAVGTRVGDLMETAPIAIVPDASVEAAAGLMRRHASDALPVVANTVCLGVVTLADVLDHLSWPTAAAPGSVPDDELERGMRQRIAQEDWTAPHRVVVDATRGRIRLTGVVRNPLERAALIAMASAIPGCAGVVDRVLVRPGGSVGA
jgi:CBS domain-containing protein